LVGPTPDSVLPASPCERRPLTATYPFSTALVTGASSGLGELMAGMLSDAGVATVVVARRVERLRVLADHHPNVEVLVADLATDDGQAAVAARIGDAERPIDLVVNNAGFGTNGTFHELDPNGSPTRSRSTWRH
jgi:short-subunit dehydrogenase